MQQPKDLLWFTYLTPKNRVKTVWNVPRVGFTLIEMSIVLVVIGLLVGGILVGRDLVRASEVRAQITQIDKLNTATNTFRDKFSALPGDLNAATASQFGFIARGILPGEGDANGILQGYFNGSAGGSSLVAAGGSQLGEPCVFWVDLSTAKLIDGALNTCTSTTIGVAGNVAGVNVDPIYPQAKIGTNNHVVVWSNGPTNYFAVVSISYMWYLYSGIAISTPSNVGPLTGVTVLQAFQIDSKVDDGLPQSGNVVAMTPFNGLGQWSGYGSNPCTATTGCTPFTASTAGSSASCFDNSSSASGMPGVAGAAQHYSIEMSSGSYTTCPISFKFQ